MRRNELTIGLVVALLALLAGYWFVVLSPKREDAASLKEDVDQLHVQLDETQQSALAGEQAKESFPADYRKLVVLGKAVPTDGDQASLLVQLQGLSDRAGVRFEAIDLDASAAADSAAPAPTPPATDSGTSSSSDTEGATPETAAVPTEATAALLPIGAAVGPAGLPVMPYQLKFTGNFFQIADFMKLVDGMVRTPKGAVDVDGRLVTVDSFFLQPIETTAPGAGQGTSSGPTLSAELTVTTYLTPADQGATGGATPTGPAIATPTSTAVPSDASSTAAPTASTP
jgi:Tfp pilus assembly protein PilO